MLVKDERRGYISGINSIALAPGRRSSPATGLGSVGALLVYPRRASTGQPNEEVLR